jgi:hypothetical protein
MSSSTSLRWLGGGATAGLLGATVTLLASGAVGSEGSGVAARAARTGEPGATGAFTWLGPTPAPGRWVSATIASGDATLLHPPNWKPIPGDRGTVTASLRDGGGRYLGYLNVTPRQGAERLGGWAAFRTKRNAAEGDTRLREVAAAENLSFDRAVGSCVIDDYRSRVGAHLYREVACIVAGSRSTVVFVGAALVRDWAVLGPVVERAASSLTVR